MIKIAVDGMGSDNSPFSEIEGTVQAAKAYGVDVILVGKESLLAPLLKEAGGDGLPIEIRNATQVIAMDEAPTAALRKKRDSSIRVAADLVREKVASGLVSAGNTGAVMAISKMVFGAVPGVENGGTWPVKRVLAELGLGVPGAMFLGSLHRRWTDNDGTN